MFPAVCCSSVFLQRQTRNDRIKGEQQQSGNYGIGFVDISSRQLGQSHLGSQYADRFSQGISEYPYFCGIPGLRKRG